MSTKPILEALDNGLSQSRDYEGRKDEVATKVKDYFVKAKKGTEPSDTEMLQHFIQKFFAKTGFDTTNLAGYTKNYLEEAFYELTSLALFSRFKQKTDDANLYFAKANAIATHTKKQFMLDYHNFAIVLDAEPLKKKLKLERCYELVNQTIAIDKDAGEKLIGTGLVLAMDIGDEKRRLDFLSKAQYVLYELESLSHAAMSLGHDILASAGGYDTLKAWTQFHMGNIWLDFKNYASARDEFEAGLDWALDAGFPYAVMTFYERLALTSLRLNKPGLAEKYYAESRVASKSPEIKPELVIKNEIRCLIGLGNLCFRKAEGQSGDEKESACNTADQHFRQALHLTSQVNYAANKKVSLINLSELCKLRRGSNDPDAQYYMTLANQV